MTSLVAAASIYNASISNHRQQQCHIDEPTVGNFFGTRVTKNHEPPITHLDNIQLCPYVIPQSTPLQVRCLLSF